MPAEDTYPKSRKSDARDARGEQHTEALTQREAFSLFVREQVLRVLGSPPNFLDVQVRPLWDRHCRVNVYVGCDAASATVAHSYFLQVDDDGNIIESTPPLKPAPAQTTIRR